MFAVPMPCRLVVLALLSHAALDARAWQLEPAKPLPQVEVKGAGSYDARRDDTAMKMVVGRDELARYGDGSVLDVLRRVPGITVTSTGRSAAQVQMRGLGGGYTQVLVDGERMPAGFSLDALAPELIERIEVLRVGTAEFSAQGIAGTINIVLRRSVRKARREAKLGYLASSDFQGPRATFEQAAGGDKSSYSLSANAEHDSLSRPHVHSLEETVAPGGATSLLRRSAMPEDGRMMRFGLTPKSNWTRDNGDTLEWQALLNGSRFRNQVRTLVATEIGSPPPVPDFLSAMEADNTSLRSTLAWTHAFASGSILLARLGIEGVQERNLQERAGKGADGLARTADRIDVATRERGVTSSGKLTRKLENGHALSAGWDGGISRRHEARVEHEGLQPLAPGLVADERFLARVSRLALYAQDEWQLATSLSVYAGVRWEGVRTRASGNGFDAADSRASVWSPVAHLLWKIPESKGDQMRIALSRTYKAPGLYNLLPRRQTWENNSPTEADFQGNPQLRPELAWGLDAAWEHYWTPAAMVSLGTALRRIGNYTGNRVYFDGTRWIMTPINEARAESRSLDLETRFPLKVLMAGAPALDVRASLSRNWSRVATIPGPDNRMEQQVPLSALIALDYKIGALSAGGSFAFKDAVTARVAIDRWAYAWARRDLDAYVVWKAGPRLQWRAALANLLGQDDGSGIAYVDAGGSVQKRRWDYPGGVKLRLTMETSF